MKSAKEMFEDLGYEYSFDNRRDEEYIGICIKEQETMLPYFEKGTMYKGMELDKEYTLEDLGL